MLAGTSPPVTPSSPFLHRKRRRSSDCVADQQLPPQAKRSGGGPCLLVSDLDSEVVLLEDEPPSQPQDLAPSIFPSTLNSCPVSAVDGATTMSQSGDGVFRSSSSDSSNGISSPERAIESSTRPSALLQKYCIRPEQEDSASSLQHCLHGHGQSASYDYINRVLREAHFSSLQTRGCPGST